MPLKLFCYYNFLCVEWFVLTGLGVVIVTFANTQKANYICVNTNAISSLLDDVKDHVAYSWLLSLGNGHFRQSILGKEIGGQDIFP